MGLFNERQTQFGKKQDLAPERKSYFYGEYSPFSKMPLAKVKVCLDPREAWQALKWPPVPLVKEITCWDGSGLVRDLQALQFLPMESMS